MCFSKWRGRRLSALRTPIDAILHVGSLVLGIGGVDMLGGELETRCALQAVYAAGAGPWLFALDDDAEQTRLRERARRPLQNRVFDAVDVELDVAGIRQFKTLYLLVEGETQDRLALHRLERGRVVAWLQRMQGRACIEAAVVVVSEAAPVGERDVHGIHRLAHAVQRDVATQLREGGKG